MKNWLKENWFKISILTCLLMITGSVLYYFVLFLPKQTEIKNTQSNKVNELQVQLISTQKELEDNSKQSQVQATQQDPTIKIERCKTQAKDYADKIAKRGYLLAAERASEAGDWETWKIYMNFSYGPSHPADYDSNYNSEYIKCLDN